MTEPSRARRLLDSTSRQVACGAQVDELLEQVADGDGDRLSAHQGGCPHCQMAIEEFRMLWAPIQDYAGQPVSVAPPLRASVLAQVNRLLHDRWFTLESNGSGTVRVAAGVVAAIARETAARVPGVRAALGRSTDSWAAAPVAEATSGHRQPDATVGILGRTPILDLALAVSYGESAHEVAREVQRRVVETLREYAGLPSVTVNVTVDDILPRPSEET
jgi:uncharacterized alkaline shock family protein YloU